MTEYNPDNWVVIEIKGKDPTNYGLTLEDAYKFEVDGMEPFSGQFLGHLGGLR